MLQALRGKLLTAAALIVLVIFIGVAGFMLIDEYPFDDALYMTIITLSTVGYGEIHPLSHDGRMFTIFLILSNLGIFTYAISTITSYLLSGDFAKQYRIYKMSQRIGDIKDHVIVCGNGRSGSAACGVFRMHKIPYVVVERNEEMLSELRQNGELHVEGDATKDEVLESAGIRRARALITALPDDSDNVFVVLTARELRADLVIISRAIHTTSISKLKRAGATEIIMPDRIGGSHMASIVVNPDIKEFVDLLSAEGSEARIEEIAVSRFKNFSGCNTISDLQLRSQTGVSLIGIRLQNGNFIINPEDDEECSRDAQLILIGTEKQFQRLYRLLD